MLCVGGFEPGARPRHWLIGAFDGACRGGPARFEPCDFQPRCELPFIRSDWRLYVGAPVRAPPGSAPGMKSPHMPALASTRDHYREFELQPAWIQAHSAFEQKDEFGNHDQTSWSRM